MSALLGVFAFMWRGQRAAMWRGALLALTVLLAGTALLGLSGWFITAATAAGLAGAGAVFDVFRPSAMVRLLAFGRTAARYGERLATHDATLRSLARLRVRLMEGLIALPWRALLQLRGGRALNRLMADVDALDGIPLRLILPLGAGLGAEVATAAVLWWLVAPSVALLLLGVHVLGAAAVFAWAARRAAPEAAAREKALQDFRGGLVDLIRARVDLVVYGRAEAERRALEARHEDLRRHDARLARLERGAGAALALVAAVAVAAALWRGAALAQAGAITPALAALGVFAALGLAEALGPVRRAAAELGRMRLAAERLAPTLEGAPEQSRLAADASPVPARESGAEPVPAPLPAPLPAPVPTPRPGAPVLQAEALGFRHPGAARPVLEGVTLAVAPAETVAVMGASGSGKSTLLEMCAGLIAPTTGQLRLLGAELARWPEPALRAQVTLVPQRSALIAGTVRENLWLAAPGAPDAALEEALASVALDRVLAGRAGLGTRLGPQGAGLSGGQARRLVLARALLRRPTLLLLDEPTEGLDRATAKRVLEGLRAALPGAAIMLAAHRTQELDWADRHLPLSKRHTLL